VSEFRAYPFPPLFLPPLPLMLLSLLLPLMLLSLLLLLLLSALLRYRCCCCRAAGIAAFCPAASPPELPLPPLSPRHARWPPMLPS